MENDTKMKKFAVGILAHVDAGKTTLSEAMLYIGGTIRKMGRVDRKDTFLDTYELEKKRGITIFSKQAVIKWRDMEVTLLDTPGHVDFSAEMERTLQVLDYAILVISGTDGVQEHTRTLWRLLAGYRVPTVVFINKMDVAELGKRAILDELEKVLKSIFVDFGEKGTQDYYEQIAMTSEKALDEFLEKGVVTTAQIREEIQNRRLFPCFFGSALKFQGIEEFMAGLKNYMKAPCYPEDFGARIFKISRDVQGNRLSHMKITGGRLMAKDMVSGDKVNQIRIYSGEKFETVREAPAGTVCAVSGLTRTAPGQGLGIEKDSVMPVLEPVMTYRILLPEGTEAAAVLPKLKEMEDEDPKLHLSWEEGKKEIHIQIMGEIQMEILKSLIADRFGVDVEFGGRSIVYRETIGNTVEGVGHFEPLGHYAEVHLLLEPEEPGSGMQYESACSEDVLGKSWQRLVLTHLAEKEHKGVLTGFAVTDMKITLMSGKAHIRHTQGGDFRQAVYRAVRQGLMQAESVLLEPFYDFRLEIPQRMIGKAMSDVERMAGNALPPFTEGNLAVLTGSAPAACIDGYQKEVIAYTGGAGRLSLSFSGYRQCHNTEEVAAAVGYDPDSDMENPSGSVFCIHGAGFQVGWALVPRYMHLESCLLPQPASVSNSVEGISRARRMPAGKNDAAGDDEEWIGTEEVDAILERTYRRGKPTENRNSRKNREKASAVPAARIYKKEAPEKEYLLVDGYNIIFAWDGLKDLAEHTIDGARGKLLDILCNYQGMKGCELIAVFDAYRVQGHAAECLDYHNIRVVFTKEAETADQYIEKFAHENGKKYPVTVATSDRLEQIIIHGQGCRLMSAGEFQEEVMRLSEEVCGEYREKKKGERNKNYLFDLLSDEMRDRMKELPEE